MIQLYIHVYLFFAVFSLTGYYKFFIFYLINLFIYFCFFGLYLWHMEVPRLGVQSELQLLDYTTATAMPDPSRACDLYHIHHSSWQRRFLNPLSERQNPQPHSYQSDSFPLSHDGNSSQNIGQSFSGSLLVIYFIYSSVYMLIPKS